MKTKTRRSVVDQKRSERKRFCYRSSLLCWHNVPAERCQGTLLRALCVYLPHGPMRTRVRGGVVIDIRRDFGMAPYGGKHGEEATLTPQVGSTTALESQGVSQAIAYQYKRIGQRQRTVLLTPTQCSPIKNALHESLRWRTLLWFRGTRERGREVVGMWPKGGGITIVLGSGFSARNLPEDGILTHFSRASPMSLLFVPCGYLVSSHPRGIFCSGASLICTLLPRHARRAARTPRPCSFFERARRRTVEGTVGLLPRPASPLVERPPCPPRRPTPAPLHNTPRAAERA